MGIKYKRQNKRMNQPIRRRDERYQTTRWKHLFEHTIVYGNTKNKYQRASLTFSLHRAGHDAAHPHADQVVGTLVLLVLTLYWGCCRGDTYVCQTKPPIRPPPPTVLGSFQLTTPILCYLRQLVKSAAALTMSQLPGRSNPAANTTPPRGVEAYTTDWHTHTFAQYWNTVMNGNETQL